MFEAYGTDGLEVFTWVVAGLVGTIAALVTTHVLKVTKEESQEEEATDEEKKKTV